MGAASVSRPRGIVGPESWRDEWTYWDLWYSVVCVADCGGDLDVLDDRIIDAHRNDRETSEAKWSHLRDLRRRLAAAGLTPARLAGDLVDEKAVLRRAREKVLRQYLYDEHRTPAMWNVPSRLTTERAKRGRWPDFPASPAEAYDRLAGTVRFRGGYRGEYKTAQVADRIQAVVSRPLAKIGRDDATRLAVRRAALTLAWDVYDVGNDSLGQLGMVSDDLVREYAAVPWRATGIRAETYWSDLLEFMAVDPYAMTWRNEVAMLRSAGVPVDLELVLGTLEGLAAGYREDRLSLDAERAEALIAYTLIAARAVDRFPDAAERLGSTDWIVLDAMVEAALGARRRDIAAGVLEAADLPGRHRNWVRTRRATL